MPTTKKINICGVSFDDIDQDELRLQIKDYLEGEPSHCFAVTPNVDFIVRAHKDESFRQLINQADLSLCDSQIVKNFAPIVGHRVKDKITGSDLFYTVLSQMQNKRLFLLGSKEEILEKASVHIKQQYSETIICGTHHGYFSDDNEVIEKINASKPDVLFVAMGSPRQEEWVQRNKEQLNLKIIACVGGLIDVIAGVVQRAPVWMQNAGLEWLWRFFHEPLRLAKRYFIDDMLFFYLLIKERFKRKK